MDKSHAELLRDLWTTYDMQIMAMKRAQQENKMLTASLHERMANQLLDAYFDLVERVIA